MSEISVFVGPTLEVAQAREHLEARYLGPAARGDVYRAALRKPWGIAIIDGYFSQAPAVWHKEILWAMSRGVHVFGAASMGALRAAELAAFGMCGVGDIFEAYRDGRCEDDDEVTVIHGPEAAGFRLMSDAMVNIRATLRLAVDRQVIGPSTGQQLEAEAKALYYADRNYSALLNVARGRAIDASELARFAAWLPNHQVDQKRLDAILLLDFIRRQQQKDSRPLQVAIRFERTDAWEQMVRQCEGQGEEQGRGSQEVELPTELLLDELRLLGGSALRMALLGALSRHLAIERADAHGVNVNRELFTETLNTFFAERGLNSPEEIQTWLDEHELDAAGLTRFMRRQSLVRWASVMFGFDAEAQLRDHLRTTSEYQRVVGRARDKQRLLRARGLESVSPADSGLTVDQIVTWYFEEHLRKAVPPDLDACALERGFADRHTLLEALLREHYYVNHAEAASPQASL